MLIDQMGGTFEPDPTKSTVQSFVKKEEIRKQIEELLRRGIIKHSQAGNYSQVLLAPKPYTNKTELRFCVDYRRLNDLTSSQSWPLPDTKQMFERLGAKRCKYFTEMNFTQGFYQIGLNPITAYITAHITFMGIYEFTRVPFGPENAQAGANSSWMV